MFLLPVSTLLEAGRFPSHYDANRKKQLVAASDISPQAQVLLVSHPWESPGNPDPSGKQFLALRRFFDQDKGQEGGGGGGEGKRGTGDGEEGGEGGFGYVWLSFSCTSSNRMRPAFRTHINNVLTVRKRHDILGGRRCSFIFFRTWIFFGSGSSFVSRSVSYSMQSPPLSGMYLRLLSPFNSIQFHPYCSLFKCHYWSIYFGLPYVRVHSSRPRGCHQLISRLHHIPLE